IFLAKLAGREDIVVGTPVAGRRHNDLEKIIGMFVNTLPLRNFPYGETGFKEFLHVVKERTLAAFSHQDYPYDELVDALTIERDTGRNPLFDTMLAIQNMEFPVVKIPGLTLKPFNFQHNIAKFDLTLIISEYGKELECTFEYCTKLFKQETIERYITYFKNTLSYVTGHPGTVIAGIEIMPQDEKRKLLIEFNNTEAIYPEDRTLHGLFEEQVNRTPDGITLVSAEREEKRRGDEEKMETEPFGRVHLSYRELDQCANRVAILLIEKGASAGNIIGIMMNRSPEMIISILGILKAGCAYLPINPKNPVERIDLMLRDSAAKIVIRRKEERKSGKAKIVFASFFLTSSQPRYLVSDSTNFAYVIFTSGSTGKPKGVPISHANISPLLHWGYNELKITPIDRTIQCVSFFFDWSVWEIFITITTGAALYIADDDVIFDTPGTIDFIHKNDITIFHITPTQFHYFLDAGGSLKTLRYLFMGGESLPASLVQDGLKILPTRCRAFNMYGLTEAAIISTAVEIQRLNDTGFEGLLNVPIGKPVGNNQLHILDKYGYLCPMGVSGELHIGGPGIAGGYMNNPELTSDKFYRSYASDNTYIQYKTGDLARWLPDGPTAGGASGGVIEFLGRIDHQVKIRGFRIELGEIESRLTKHNSVRDALVVVNQGLGGDKYLCAYIVPKEPGVFEEDQLINYLTVQLPGYMVPTYWVSLDKIPLNANGKINLRALPQPGYVSESVFEPPANETEDIFTAIWSDLLGIKKEKISVQDNFFRMGGHSLKATVLISRIHKELHIKIPLAEIFKTPTIRDMARLIRGMQEESFHVVEPVEKKEYYPLSSAQKRLYFLQQLDLQSIGYNMPMVLPLGKEINKEKLELALKQLIARHESLRTSFERVNEEIVQRVHEQVAFAVETLATDAYGVHGQTQTFIRPFDLAKAPLMRSGLITMPDGNFTWVLDIHHIVSDGTSHTILTRDFMHFYNSDSPLPPLPIQYKDFSHWQSTLFAGEQVKSQWDYWQQVYTGEIPRLHLPGDYKRPGVFTFAGAQYQCRIEIQEAAAFKDLGARYEGTLYMNLYMNMMAALNTLFYKYTGQTDIIIGSGIAGRRHADIQNVVGMFVNTLAMRNYPSGEKTYEQFLKEVIAASVKGFENQDVQFEELVEKLEPERDPSRNPLFDVSMVVQNFQESPGEETIVLPADNIPIFDYKNRTAKFDLTFFISEAAGDIYIDIEYYTGIFREETIIRMVSHLKNLLKAIIANPGRKLKNIDILSIAEKEQLLEEFNYTTTAYPKEQTVHALFEEQVSRVPGCVALVYEDQSLSFRELDQRANQLAHYLQSKHLQPGEFVGVLLDRSLGQIIALLAVLKAGGAYLPLDHALPENRIKLMIADTQLTIILSAKRFIRILNKLQWECPSFNSFLCLDSTALYLEEEVEKSGLMDENLWDYVANSASDEITGGGWFNSYNGEAFSTPEMAEYGDNVLKKLLPLLHEKMNILEIGCGSGITMYRIAPKVGTYYATDLSQGIIENNRKKITLEGYRNISLARLAAHEIDQLDRGTISI
ncbi:MAG: amino acid adenylation domain-containing protein, partial [Acidobacteria bacterium]|nr:amino acid adenylation domain-containing protein [Acidobacteriota bacterium]